MSGNQKEHVRISFASSRSQFIAPCELSIRKNRDRLDKGAAIRVALLPAVGYRDQVVVTISAGESAEFDAEWQGADATRFPARIKAAATALRNCGLEGKFVIGHGAGNLSITRS